MENTRKGMIQEKEERRSVALGTEGLRQSKAMEGEIG
jgi:hypothetical protein